MREIYDKLAFMLAGLVHLLPVAGISGAAKLEALYGVEIAHDPVLTLLMQHRALLFGIIGFFLIMAVWHTQWRPAARLIALVSMLGFVVLHVASGVDAPALAKVFWADALCSLLLLATFLPVRKAV